MHLYQLCYNARRMDRHSEAELWARFKAARPQDACAVTPARPAPHPMPEQIDAALEWARLVKAADVIDKGRGIRLTSGATPGDPIRVDFVASPRLRGTLMPVRWTGA